MNKSLCARHTGFFWSKNRQKKPQKYDMLKSHMGYLTENTARIYAFLTIRMIKVV